MRSPITLHAILAGALVSLVAVSSPAQDTSGTSSRRLPPLPAGPPLSLPSVRRPAPPVPVASARDTGAPPAASVAAPAAPQDGTGRIVGTVLDGESGRPLQGVQVVVLGPQRLGGVTDLDGRYQIQRVPAGRQTVVARLIGFRPVQRDSVIVPKNGTITLPFSLRSVPAQLQAVAVTAEAVRTSNSDAGLLALQKAAPGVSDGISAAAMSRAPAANAADAIVRVPGVSVVGNRFVVVRGLQERYSNTLLNGAELPSPEPARRVVPLDIFPSRLLESIVTTKSATPDKPGDFVAGLVEIKTREFPDEFQAQAGISGQWHSLTTGLTGNFPIREAGDRFASGDAARAAPDGLQQTPAGGIVRTDIAQRMRSVWLNAPSRAAPNLSGDASVGGQLSIFGTPLGLVGAVTFNNEQRRLPNRFFAFLGDERAETAPQAFTFDEWTTAADVSGLLNMSWRPATWTKLGLKNLATRSAEDVSLVSDGFALDRAPGRSLRQFQRRYVARELLQSQLSGEHTLGLLADSRFEWRVTTSRARRLEPENRQVEYLLTAEGTYAANFANGAREIWERTLVDRSQTIQGDWTVGFSRYKNRDGALKIGGLGRAKQRVFDAFLYQYFTGSRTTEVRSLPPDQSLAPENFGDATAAFYLTRFGARAQPYTARDEIGAAYGMVDLPVTRWLRVVGGARWENWQLALDVDTRDTLSSAAGRVRRAVPDILPSVNVTVRLGERANFRLSYFDAVSRPDARELSPDEYNAVVAECTQVGNTRLQRARTSNADARFEFYPTIGEIVSASVFVKRFTDAIVETSSDAGTGGCFTGFGNAERAENLGAELEFRRGLRFLPGVLGRRLALSLNATYTDGRAFFRLGPGSPLLTLPLQGQSRWLTNTTLAWGDAGDPVQATFLVNWFSDRVLRYGAAAAAGSTVAPPNIYEVGRTTIDLKVDRRAGSVTVSLSARNLLDQPFQQYVTLGTGRLLTAFNPVGRFVQTKVSYAF